MNINVLIGHLGANAEAHNEGGREFVTFRVAHSETYTKADGTQVDSTMWVSCIMQGRNEKLVPYLVKGQQVCVIGTTRTRLYNSAKDHGLKAGLDMQVSRIELIGGRPDPIPRYLFDAEGLQLEVVRYAWVDPKKAAKGTTTLFDNRGQAAFTMDKKGWLSAIQPAAQPTEQAGQANVEPDRSQDNAPAF